MNFFNTDFGQYLIQTVFHSLIIAIVIESMISTWHIRNPFIKLKFRLLPLLLPALYLPLFYLVYPPRSGLHFHEQVALMDTSQWLSLHAGIAVWHLVVTILILTTLLFIFKEAIPGMKHLLTKQLLLAKIGGGDFPKLDTALANLSKSTSQPMPEIFLSARDMPVLYIRGRRTLVMSASTIDILDIEELEAVLAHELAHLIRQTSFVNRMFLALRVLMFYNPVAMLIFRYTISENEMICDDMAISLTGKHLALASGLLKVFSSIKEGSYVAETAAKNNWASPRINTLKNRAYRELIKERVERMVHPQTSSDSQYQNLRLLIISALLVVLLFFIV